MTHDCISNTGECNDITYIVMAVLTVCIMHGVYLLVKDAEVRFRQRREMNKDATNNK